MFETWERWVADSTGVHSGGADPRNIWAAVAAGDTQARNAVIEQHLPLVSYTVGRMNLNIVSSGTLDYEDLIGFGQLGLIDAVERYDHTRGIAFSTYAMRRIRGAIMDELRAMDWAPRSVRSKQRRIAKAAHSASQSLGRDPSLEELAERAGMSPEDVEKALADASGAYVDSFDRPVANASMRGSGKVADDVQSHTEFLADGEALDPQMSAEMADTLERIAKGLGRISDQAQTFLALYYLEEWSFSDIGKVLGVTESRICQVHTQAMRELRMSV